jgi:hypothetical protein
MPFVLQERTIHIGGVQKKPMKRPRRRDMNWIFDAYTNVYQTAMMQSHEPKHDAAPAKERARVKGAHVKPVALFGFLKRR